MFDIDHFKGVNDRFGHDVGDKVIRHIARHAQGLGGTVGRLGGEEFGCLLPGVGVAATITACERFRELVMCDPLKAASGTIWVTVSIGLAECRTSSPPDAILKRADVGVYRAKAGGRNQTVVVTPGDDLAMPDTNARIRNPAA